MAAPSFHTFPSVFPRVNGSCSSRSTFLWRVMKVTLCKESGAVLQNPQKAPPPAHGRFERHACAVLRRPMMSPAALSKSRKCSPSSSCLRTAVVPSTMSFVPAGADPRGCRLDPHPGGVGRPQWSWASARRPFHPETSFVARD